MVVRRPEGETKGRTLPTSVALISSLLGILPTYITLLGLTSVTRSNKESSVYFAAIGDHGFATNLLCMRQVR